MHDLLKYRLSGLPQYGGARLQLVELLDSKKRVALEVYRILAHSCFLTRCVAMPSLIAARWVGKNSGLIFRRLWTKLHELNLHVVSV